MRNDFKVTANEVGEIIVSCGPNMVFKAANPQQGVWLANRLNHFEDLTVLMADPDRFHAQQLAETQIARLVGDNIWHGRETAKDRDGSEYTATNEQMHDNERGGKFVLKALTCLRRIFA